MSTRPQFLTLEGKQQLEAELENLVNVKRPALASQLRAAIEAGDISESAAYEDAKHQQGMLEGRIIELQNLLKTAKVIEANHDKASSQVDLGSKVLIVDENGREEEFRLVGSAEARAREGRISYESPVGKALLGRQVGETVEVKAPAGMLHFTIKAVIN